MPGIMLLFLLSMLGASAERVWEMTCKDGSTHAVAGLSVDAILASRPSGDKCTVEVRGGAERSLRPYMESLLNETSKPAPQTVKPKPQKEKSVRKKTAPLSAAREVGHFVQLEPRFPGLAGPGIRNARGKSALAVAPKTRFLSLGPASY